MREVALIHPDEILLEDWLKPLEKCRMVTP
ncbi:hypothetical protein O1Q79_00049 [Lonepinella sp. MS14434]